MSFWGKNSVKVYKNSGNGVEKKLRFGVKNSPKVEKNSGMGEENSGLVD